MTLLDAVHRSQKVYYDQRIANKADFKPIVDFGGVGRAKLFGRNGFSLRRGVGYILLEGVVNSTGQISGVVFSDKETVVYSHTSKGWRFIRGGAMGADSIRAVTGIGVSVIERVRVWDVGYIEGLKKVIGSGVSDGFSLMASRIGGGSNPPVIETIGFYEFK